jgi:formylmethanofuran dehydrogenase subunit E
MIEKIVSFTFTDFVDRVEAFHGFSAPGVVLGGVMVDLALRHLPDRILYDAFCETEKCLPDAIQLLTPCTVGNGWLKVRPWGRFALALYDKQAGTGIRVRLNLERVDDCPDIKGWYYKLQPKEARDRHQLLKSIQRVGHGLCQVQEIQVHPDLLIKESRGRPVCCPDCREFFPSNGNGVCPACRGEARRVYRENNR